jgi:ribosomal protein L15E
MSILGICPEDDDGNAAVTQGKQSSQQSQPKQEPKPQPKPEVKPEPKTPDQILGEERTASIRHLLGGLTSNFTNKDKMMAIMLEMGINDSKKIPAAHNDKKLEWINYLMEVTDKEIKKMQAVGGEVPY